MEYKVKFVDYPKQYHSMKKEIDDAISDCLEGGDYIMRHQMKDFEKHLAEYLGVKHVIGVNSCTDALFLALKAFGIKEGDEVITVAHTFVATLNTIVACGATPVLIDVDYDTFNMDMNLLEKAITPRTKAIVPVHLNGRCCDMGELMELAHKYNLKVSEDAAQALGAEYNHKKVHGNAYCMSFYPAKMLGALGDAGALATDDDEISQKIMMLRDHCLDEKNDVHGWGFNSSLHNIQAAVLDAKLKHLPDWIQRRRQIFLRYTESLSEILEVRVPITPEYHHYLEYSDVCLNYVIRVQNRDELYEYLKKYCGIETIVSWWHPLHKYPELDLHCSLPITERLSREVISLPCNTEITDEQIDYVVDSIRKFYNKCN